MYFLQDGGGVFIHHSAGSSTKDNLLVSNTVHRPLKQRTEEREPEPCGAYALEGDSLIKVFEA